MPKYTSWARLLLLLFSCQGSSTPFQGPRHMAAKSISIYSSRSLQSSSFFYFLLAFKVRNSKNIPITCRSRRRPSARALKTAANYLIPIHPSRRKSAIGKKVLWELLFGDYVGHARRVDSCRAVVPPVFTMEIVFREALYG